MLKTDREKRICAKYSMQDEDGYVHCSECPLRVNSSQTDVGCKAWLHYDRHLRDWVMDEDGAEEMNAAAITSCKHCMGVRQNEIGEVVAFCEEWDCWRNVSLGECFRNCEQQEKEGGT